MEFLDSSRPKLLLLLKDPSLAQVLIYNLTRDGFDVICIENTFEALQRIGVLSPDIALVQIESPDELMQFIAVLGHNSGPRRARIMVIGPPHPGYSEGALAAGIDDWLRTPFSLPMLTQRIRQLLA
jgi:DNA-binding response OmpR family regulator